MRTGEKYLQLQAVEILAKLGQLPADFCFVAGLLGGRLVLGQFEHDLEIIDLALGLEDRFGFLAE